MFCIISRWYNWDKIKLIGTWIQWVEDFLKHVYLLLSFQIFPHINQSLLISSELYKMVCDPDETDLDIHISAVMLPQDAGSMLEKMSSNGSSGDYFIKQLLFWLSESLLHMSYAAGVSCCIWYIFLALIDLLDVSLDGVQFTFKLLMSGYAMPLHLNYELSKHWRWAKSLWCRIWRNHQYSFVISTWC